MLDKREATRENKYLLRNERKLRNKSLRTWGCSSVGRALPPQGRGRGFDSLHLHHVFASFNHIILPVKTLNFVRAMFLFFAVNRKTVTFRSHEDF